MCIRDRYVSEEIRNLAMEQHTITVTASQLNRCLTLDTNVEVNGKLIKISDLQIGDIISSNDGNVIVNEILPITKQRVYEIKTKSGKTIKCSAKHLFPTSTGLLRNIENGLCVGEKLYIKSMENIPKKCDLDHQI